LSTVPPSGTFVLVNSVENYYPSVEGSMACSRFAK
jgi:hypothetical protein